MSPERMPEPADCKDRLLGEAPVSTEPKKVPTAIDTAVLKDGAFDAEAQRTSLVTPPPAASSWEVIDGQTEEGQRRLTEVVEALWGNR